MLLKFGAPPASYLQPICGGLGCTDAIKNMIQEMVAKLHDSKDISKMPVL